VPDNAAILLPASGGTGLSSFTANGIVYASSTSALATGSTLTFDAANGRLILNTTGTAYATGGVTAQYQIGGTTQAASSMALITSSATTTTDPTIFLAKNKSGTQGTFTTAVVNTDELGAIRFAGSNTSTLAAGAEIKGVATGTWSTTSQPTDLVFSTVVGATTTLYETMRVSTNQEVIVGAGLSGVTTVTGGPSITSMGTAGGGVFTLYRNDATVSSGNALGYIDFSSNGSGSILYAATIGAEATGTFTASSTPTALTFDTCASGATVPEERARIDSSGRLLIGSPNTYTWNSITSGVQVNSVSDDAASMSLSCWSSTSTDEASLNFAKPNGNAIGSYAALAANDNIGIITFSGGASASTALVGAYIFVEADAAYTATAAPSRMIFATGSSTGTATERMRISSTGAIDMAATSSLQKNSTDAYLLKNIVSLTSGTNATYTTPTGVRALKVTVVGGGGGGGGVDGAGASTYATSSGGAGGGWAEALLTSVAASYTYTVGGGGAGGAAGNNNGITGGTTEFKNAGSTVVISATGGTGGNGDLGAVSAGAAGVLGGIGSLTGVTGIIAAGIGTNYSRVINSTYTNMGFSGGSKFGGGQTIAQPGAAARVYGEGGGATYAGAVTTNYAGGNGFQGVIIIEEYY
jgi:hypothetical protein